MKKLFAVLLAVAMLLSLGVTAFADGKITVANAPANVDYAAYKIFDAEVNDENEVVYILKENSPWVDVLVDPNNQYNSKFANLEFMESSTKGGYVVISQTGFSAADFAAYLVEEMPDGLTPVISQDDPATADLNNQDNTQVILNLEDGYYLVLQIEPIDEDDLVETAAALDSNFRYIGTDAGATGEIGTGDGKLSADLYEETKYYKNGDEIVPASYFATLSAEEKDTYNEYHYRRAEITETAFKDLSVDEKANYSPNATAFDLAIPQLATPLTEKAYNALATDAQRALYEKAADVWYHDTNDPDHDNPIDDATYQAFDDDFKANFVAGATYQYKTEITSAEYMALATTTDNGLMDNYNAKVTTAQTGGQLVTRPGVDVSLKADATPALTTVINGQNVQIQNKDDMPLEKTVEDEAGNDINNQGVSVGDELNYTITTKVPVRSGDPGETIFNLWDTMSEGLTLKDNQIKITIGDNDDTKIEYTITYHEGNGTYENRSSIDQVKKVGGVEVEGANDFTLVLDPKEPLTGYAIRFAPESKDGYTFELSLPVNSADLRALAGQKILVEYIGVVNDEAVAEVLKNAASLHFKDDNGEWIKDVETDNYISRIVIDKFETGNRTQKLAGAEFVLWRNAGAADVVSQAELDAAYAAAQQAAYDAVLDGYYQAAYDAKYSETYSTKLTEAKTSTTADLDANAEGVQTYSAIKTAAEQAYLDQVKAEYAASIGKTVAELGDAYDDYWKTSAVRTAAGEAGTAAADAAAEAYAVAAATTAAEEAGDAAIDATEHADRIAEANNAKAAVVKNTDAIAEGDKIYYQLTSNGALVSVARYTDDSGIQYEKPLKVDENGALVLDAEGNPQMLENLKVNWTPDIKKATKVVTDANGFAQFAFLPDGTYQLEETKPPVDYTKLLNPITIEVNGKDALDQSLSQTQRENALSNIAYVENTPGTSLPSTGGVGATMMTIGGIALILAAGAFLVIRRRKEQE